LCSDFVIVFWSMGILEKIAEIEKEISRTQKNKGIPKITGVHPLRSWDRSAHPIRFLVFSVFSYFGTKDRSDAASLVSVSDWSFMLRPICFWEQISKFSGGTVGTCQSLASITSKHLRWILLLVVMLNGKLVSRLTSFQPLIVFQNVLLVIEFLISIFDCSLHIRNLAHCIKNAHLFVVSLQI